MRSRRNQLIHRRLTKTKSIGSGQDPESHAGRQSAGYGGWCLELRRGGRYGEGKLKESPVAHTRGTSQWIPVDVWQMTWMFSLLPALPRTFIRGTVREKRQKEDRGLCYWTGWYKVTESWGESGTTWQMAAVDVRTVLNQVTIHSLRIFI